jgi:shikimate kinase
MKNLYLIGGTMGVGKTTVSQLLKKQLNNSVFLDGDWCWDADPFVVTDETKTMVMNNICYQLNNFIHCSAYENIIFCWVMHEQSIIDEIVERIDTNECNCINISLICSEDALRKRIRTDIKNGLRTEDTLERSIARIPLYQSLKTIKIDTSDQSAAAVAKQIEAKFGGNN